MSDTGEETKQRLRQILSHCPICTDVIHPPIRTCVNQHATCGDCYNKLKLFKNLSLACPVCLGPFTHPNSFDSFILTRGYTLIELKCKYWRYGCKEVLLGRTLRIHMETCPFKSKKCPFRNDLGCIWEGPEEMFALHFMEYHLGQKNEC